MVQQRTRCAADLADAVRVEGLADRLGRGGVRGSQSDKDLPGDHGAALIDLPLRLRGEGKSAQTHEYPGAKNPHDTSLVCCTTEGELSASSTCRFHGRLQTNRTKVRNSAILAVFAVYSCA